MYLVRPVGFEPTTFGSGETRDGTAGDHRRPPALVFKKLRQLETTRDGPEPPRIVSNLSIERGRADSTRSSSAASRARSSSGACPVVSPRPGANHRLPSEERGKGDRAGWLPRLVSDARVTPGVCSEWYRRVALTPIRCARWSVACCHGALPVTPLPVSKVGAVFAVGRPQPASRVFTTSQTVVAASPPPARSPATTALPVRARGARLVRR
jgi:hypothetical protein